MGGSGGRSNGLEERVETPLEPSVLHLTGPLRGVRRPLPADGGPIGVPDGPTIRPLPGGRFELDPCGSDVRLDDEPIETRVVVETGSLLSLGTEGPHLRLLLVPESRHGYKTMRATLRDCVDCARQEAATPVGRLAAFLKTLPHDLLVHTAPAVRLALGTLLLLLAVSVAALFALGVRLEERLAAAEQRSVLAQRSIERRIERHALSIADPDARVTFEAVAAELSKRLSALEDLGDAARRVVRDAEPAVVFLQGEYGWRTPEGEHLRARVTPDGRAFFDPVGQVQEQIGGLGPPLTVPFTGSSFLVGRDGLLVTNRHVVQPWRHDPAARSRFEAGLLPVLHLIAWAPGSPDAARVEVVRVSETADVALVRARGLAVSGPPLRLATRSPEPGDEIVLLGYPAGVDALLARLGTPFVDSLRATGAGFWTISEELAAADLILPLASRGIVAQVTPASVVYDAETGRGGSGGPVLSRDGEVVAVNFAILPAFGGSNLGVPVEELHALLADHGSRP